MHQVRKFMHDQIVAYGDGHFNDVIGIINVFLGRAAGPERLLVLDGDIVVLYAHFLRPLRGLLAQNFARFFAQPPFRQRVGVGLRRLNIHVKSLAVKFHAFFLVRRQVHPRGIQSPFIEDFARFGFGVFFRPAEHFRHFFFEAFNKKFYVADDALRVAHSFIISIWFCFPRRLLWKNAEYFIQ